MSTEGKPNEVTQLKINFDLKEEIEFFMKGKEYIIAKEDISNLHKVGTDWYIGTEKYSDWERDRDAFLKGKGNNIPKDEQPYIRKIDGIWGIGNESYDKWKLKKGAEAREWNKSDRNDLYPHKGKNEEE